MKLQARSFERLRLLVLLYSVVAMRLLNLKHLARLDPELDADRFWSRKERDIRYRAQDEDAPGQAPPPVRGGPGRCGPWRKEVDPRDGPPGIRVLWKSMQGFCSLLGCVDNMA